jgi:hypothetical protein
MAAEDLTRPIAGSDSEHRETNVVPIEKIDSDRNSPLSAPRYQAATAIALTDVITEECYSDPVVALPIFYETSLQVDYSGGFVYLASTPDGTGHIVTDDVAELHVDDPGHEPRSRSWDFRDLDQGKMLKSLAVDRLLIT